MQRRLFLSLLLILPTLSFGQSDAVAGRIALLEDLVKALGAAGEAISKLTAGFKDLVSTGADGYNYVAARRERTRLLEISRRTANLFGSNQAVVDGLDEYVALHNRNEADWRNVARNVNSTLSKVQMLLADVESENGDFVLQNTSLALKETLTARSLLLQQLAEIPAPASNEELALLVKASEKYKVLIANAKEAVKELNAYVKAKK